MTVFMTQINSERKSYTYENVHNVEIYRAKNGCYMMRIAFEDGGCTSFPVEGYSYDIK